MKTPPANPLSLIAFVGRAEAPGRTIATGAGVLNPDDLLFSTSLNGSRDRLADRNVILVAGDQLRTAAALIELDGLAHRIVLCPPDISGEALRSVAATAEADAVVYGADGAPPPIDVALAAPCGLPLSPSPAPRARRIATQWALLTSGTTGAPKLAAHDLTTLTAAFSGAPSGAAGSWATFYDIRRYGGLQIFLRALAGAASLTLTEAGEPLDAYVTRLRARAVTHMSGTPSHWRRLLMSETSERFSPQYIRLSGEISDPAVLASLHARYPKARIGHAYASTEAGVVFEIVDGQAGFPAAYLGERADGVATRIEDGSLRVRSRGLAHGYIGRDAPTLRDASGFVDTGDMIETDGDRCFFAGRRGGVINVGGAKVHPEEIEAVINQHAHVRMSLVRAKRSPITGALVVADIVLDDSAPAHERLREDILAACRANLAPYKVPALLRFVPSLAVTMAGKLARNG